MEATGTSGSPARRRLRLGRRALGGPQRRPAGWTHAVHGQRDHLGRGLQPQYLHPGQSALRELRPVDPVRRCRLSCTDVPPPDHAAAVDELTLNNALGRIGKTYLRGHLGDLPGVVLARGPAVGCLRHGIAADLRSGVGRQRGPGHTDRRRVPELGPATPGRARRRPAQPGLAA